MNDVPVGWAEDLYVSVSNSGQDTEVSGQSEPVPETPSISLNSTAFRRVLNGVMEHNAALSAGIHPSRLRALSEAPEPQRGDGCETRTPYAVTGSNAIGFDTPFLSSSGTPTSGNPVNASTSTIAISDIPPAGVHPSRLKLLSEPFEPPREDHETARVPFVVTGANAIGFDLISPSVVDGLASSSREKSSLLRSRRGKERNKGWDLPAPGEDLSTTKVITSTWDSDADQGWGGSSDATKITESPVRERSRQVQPRRENNDFNWNADFVPLPQEARQIPLPGSGKHLY